MCLHVLMNSSAELESGRRSCCMKGMDIGGKDELAAPYLVKSC